MLLDSYVPQHSDDFFALLAYADALRIIGRHTDAERLLKPRFESASRPVQVAAAKGLAMATETTKPEEAEYWFLQYVALSEDVPGWAWVLRGANLSRLERFDEAIDCYLKALQVGDVDRDEALVNISLAYRAKGDYRQALVYLNRADMVSITPQTAELRAGLEGLEDTRRFLEGTPGATGS